MKPIAFASVTSVSGRAAARSKAERECDHEVLGDEDRQHEVGLVVCKPPKVDQPLDRHCARGDVDRRGQDQRREAEPEGSHADQQAEAGVHREIDRPADQGMTATAREPAERELEAEEEEQEDEADLGDEVRHLGRIDQREERRLVRAEEQPCEQVGRDRGQPEAARDQPQDPEHRDRDGELRERHRRVFF